MNDLPIIAQFILAIINKNKKKKSNRDHTFAISSGVRAPLMSCLFARMSKDAPDSLCQIENQENTQRQTRKSNQKRG